MVQAQVREWHDDLGWGVLDSPETSGGCWTHFSAVQTPRVNDEDERVAAYGFKSLKRNDLVDLEWARPGQDGFDYRAAKVRTR